MIGTYWVDIIEQLVPATTIWGATYIYRNTVFDQIPYKYRRGTTYFCTADTFSTSASTFCTVLASATTADTIQIIVTDLVMPATSGSSTSLNCIIDSNVPTICYDLFIDQLDDGSEFRGTVSYVVNRRPPTPHYLPANNISPLKIILSENPY